MTLYDRQLLEEAQVNVDFEAGAPMDILVENMGRVNFGPPHGIPEGRESRAACSSTAICIITGNVYAAA